MPGKMGPKSKYWTHVKPRFREIEEWLEDGLTEAQIIKNLGVGKTAWEDYKNRQDELVELIKKGKLVQITEVENSLFKAATGFYYYVEEKAKIKDADGNERLEKITVKKFKPPEVAAICFYLKNRAGSKWADNPHGNTIKREELALRKELAKFNDW